MVATDIAARGLHADGIGLVIHADPPAEHKAYVHRSGRTARGGAAGTVVTVQTAVQAAGVRAGGQVLVTIPGRVIGRSGRTPTPEGAFLLPSGQCLEGAGFMDLQVLVEAPVRTWSARPPG